MLTWAVVAGNPLTHIFLYYKLCFAPQIAYSEDHLKAITYAITYDIKTKLYRHSRELRTDIPQKTVIGCPSVMRATSLPAKRGVKTDFKTAKINR